MYENHYQCPLATRCNIWMFNGSILIWIEKHKFFKHSQIHTEIYCLQIIRLRSVQFYSLSFYEIITWIRYLRWNNIEHPFLFLFCIPKSFIFISNQYSLKVLLEYNQMFQPKGGSFLKYTHLKTREIFKYSWVKRRILQLIVNPYQKD